MALDSVFLGSVVALLRANKKVRRKIADVTPEFYSDDDQLQHSLDALQNAREATVDRLRRIEDKATSTVIGVGIAVAIIGSASAFLGGDSPLADSSAGARAAVATLLVAAIFYLLLSGYMALRAYAVGEVYGPTLRDTHPLVSEDRAKLMALYCIEQNHRVGTLRANYLSASFACLRNGLALLATLGLVLVVTAYWSSLAHTRLPPL
jgi:hypothetical protein